MERAIEAIRIMRAWRDSVGVRPGDDRGRDARRARLRGDRWRASPSAARFAFDADGDGAAAPVASIAIPGGTVAVLASADVDLGAAERRLEEQRATLRSEIERAERKLANAGFVAKAPPAVVDAERAKLERLRAELEAR